MSQRRSGQASGDIFKFFDEDFERGPQRQGRRSSRTGRRSQIRSEPVADNDALRTLDEDEDEDEESATVDVDDNIDDGFFSRYRKEAGPGQRLTDYSALDAPPGNDDMEVHGDRIQDRKGGRGASTPRRMDRQTAASAFDAVDRLFGSINSTKTGKQQGKTRQSRAQGAQQGSAGEAEKPQRRSQLDRRKWLDDVRARASTKGEPEFDEDDSTAVDVDAVEDLSEDVEDDAEGSDDSTDEEMQNELDERVTRDDFDEAEIGGKSAAEEMTSRTSGFNDLRSSERQEKLKDRNGGTGNAKGKTMGSAKSFSFYDDEAFQNLMNIARMGPPDTSGGQRRKQSGRNSRQPRAPGSSGTEQRSHGKAHEHRRGSRETHSQSEGREPAKPDVSRLLGLTKQIISNQEDTNQLEYDDDYEPVDDEMEKSVVLGGTAVRDRTSGTRHLRRFSAVRRTAGQGQFMGMGADTVAPISEDEVASVMSDSRSIGGGIGNSLSRGVVADCPACRGTGLETCSVCLGSGWLPPPAKERDPSRRAMLEEIWNRPNLVVNFQGEAQCVHCNGIGKQFCSTCEGSGSALKKGFSLADKNEVFDIFPGGHSFSGEFDADEEIGDDDDEEEEEEEEDFQLYTGPEEVFDIKGKAPTSEESAAEETEDSTLVVDDLIEVEDESVELLAALEAMHLADLEEGRNVYPGGLSSGTPLHKGNDGDDEDDEDDDDDEFRLVMEDDDEDEDIDEELAIENDDAAFTGDSFGT